jgi:hypothetical protein
MVWAAAAIRWIPMSRAHNLRVQSGGTLECVLKIVDFKPQEYSVAVRFVIRVSDRAVVMLNLEAM